MAATRQFSLFPDRLSDIIPQSLTKGMHDSTGSSAPVGIIGAGLAGLSCAKYLAEKKIPFQLLEASDSVGGRVRTDEVEGCLLDRGFQVFQTAYPEARRVLDYGRLDLIELEPGALIRRSGRWHRMSDPLRRPKHLLQTLFNPIGNFRDRLRLLGMRSKINSRGIDAWLQSPEDCSTISLLRTRYRFTSAFIDQFMKPWLSGIFLETHLDTSANYFAFVFKMLSSGPIAYPRQGIQAIPLQLAEAIPSDQLRLNCSVSRIAADESSGYVVSLASGEQLHTSAVVMATELRAAAGLAKTAGIDLGSVADRRCNTTVCIYYLADKPPITEPILMLNGDSAGPINHAFVLTNAVPSLAPEGKALISVSLVGDAARQWDRSSVRANLEEWFGEQAGCWRELQAFEVKDALPEQPPGFYTQRRSTTLPQGLFLCGDYLETTSVQGALKSGREAAEQVLAFQQSRRGHS